jgi:DNA modification methylase
MVNDNYKLNNSGVSNAADTIDLPRHRWYYYKEGFSPNLVENAIEEYGLNGGSVILDPFNGSGTVTLTAAKRNIKSQGVEINPFTSFLAKTKALNEKQNSFDTLFEQTLEACIRGSFSKLEGFSTFTESKANTKKWLFNTDVLRAFNGGMDLISDNRTNAAKLMKLALISSAMENCNASKDGKCLRYRSEWELKPYSKDTFISSFIKKTDTIREDLSERLLKKPQISTFDTRLSKRYSSLEDFDLCITSPPYLNTFDYTDIYRPELFLGRFIKSSEELYKLRLKTVRSHIQANWKKPDVRNIDSVLLKDVYSKIESKNDMLMHKNIPAMILAYFEDMSIIFKSLSNNAKKSAHVWMVVSTSAYANEHIPVDLILGDIATHNGWKLKEIGVLREINKRMTRYSPDISKLRESVIILSKD